MFPAPDTSSKPVTVLSPVTNTIVAEDNMNVQLKDITVTARDGRVSHLDQVYIRGSHVRFFIVPDMLRYNLFWQRYRKDLFLGGETKVANGTAGMRPCSDQEGRGGEGLVWREEGRPSTGQEAREVQEVVDRGLRDEEGRSSDRHEECNNKTRIWHDIAWLGTNSFPKRGRSAQKSAKIDQGGFRFPTIQEQTWKINIKEPS